MMPKVAVLTGFGLNCEIETAYVFNKCGAKAEMIHINDVISGSKALDQFQILAFIGGFSFGDHIASGRVLSIKFKYRLKDQLNDFLQQDKLIVGLFNGFQTLVKLGILPGNEEYEGKQVVTLTHNQNPGYRDDWVNLKFNEKSNCVFTKNLDFMKVPVRHGEGRFLALDDDVLNNIQKYSQAVCYYADPKTMNETMQFPYNPNGSVNGIAGICSPNGKVFGMMPHPEAFHSYYNQPQWYLDHCPSEEEGDGLKIFKNAVSYFN